MEIKNYEDVKTFVATLTPEQLKQKVSIQVLDESSIEVTEMLVNDVDYFYNEDSEGLIPVELYVAEEWEHDLSDESYNTIVKAGTRVFAYDDSFGEDDKVTHVIKPYQIKTAMEAIGFKTIEHGWDKMVFNREGVIIEVPENMPLSALFLELMKSVRLI